MLTEAQQATYHRDGFVAPLTAFDAATAEHYRRCLVRDCADTERTGSQAGLRQPSTRVKPYLLFPWAAELVRHPGILDAVAAVIGPDILVFHTTVWWKPAGSDGLVPWHQDATYFGLAPHEHVTAWVALSPSTRDSGCVRVLPGSQDGGQRAHQDRRDPAVMLSRGQTLAEAVDEARAVPIELAPGQFSLHHTLALHASAPNRAGWDRIGVGISYVPTRVRHIGETRLSATLAQGEDRYGHFDLEPAPLAEAEALAAATHADSIARFWRASESIPEMALVH